MSKNFQYIYQTNKWLLESIDKSCEAAPGEKKRVFFTLYSTKIVKIATEI